MKLKERFEKYHEEEFLEFDRIKNPLSNRADLAAFILLDKIVPGKEDIICAAEHDEFFLSIDPDKFNMVATDEDILTLIRCGVIYDNSTDCLQMFA